MKRTPVKSNQRFAVALGNHDRVELGERRSVGATKGTPPMRDARGAHDIV